MKGRVVVMGDLVGGPVGMYDTDASVGSTVGGAEFGATVGRAVGSLVRGAIVGAENGLVDGERVVGVIEGAELGCSNGPMLGISVVGGIVGRLVGSNIVGNGLGDVVGGELTGIAVGDTRVGSEVVGADLGADVGADVGPLVGCIVDRNDGDGVGLAEGIGVGGVEVAGADVLGVEVGTGWHLPQHRPSAMTNSVPSPQGCRRGQSEDWVVVCPSWQMWRVHGSLRSTHAVPDAWLAPSSPKHWPSTGVIGSRVFVGSGVPGLVSPGILMSVPSVVRDVVLGTMVAVTGVGTRVTVVATDTVVSAAPLQSVRPASHSVVPSR